ANLNDSHNQMVVHWAGEKSNVIVALARDSVGATDPKSSSVYLSYDYGTTFIHISDKFVLPRGKETSQQVISQFYHSPADNRRPSPLAPNIIASFREELTVADTWELKCCSAQCFCSAAPQATESQTRPGTDFKLRQEDS
ncbi:sortilin-related receptor isoform X1, partial [Tachysurus ichikawai]